MAFSYSVGPSKVTAYSSTTGRNVLAVYSHAFFRQTHHDNTYDNGKRQSSYDTVKLSYVSCNKNLPGRTKASVLFGNKKSSEFGTFPVLWLPG
jgi:hypothetical protein